MNEKTKRLIAYFLDAILVTLLVSILTGNKYTNPYLDKYNDTYSEYQTIYEKYQKEEITESEYKEEYNKYNYQLNKYNIYSTSIQMVCLLLYFGLFQYLNKNQTLGKKIMNIKIISAKDENNKVTLVNYFIRVLVLNGIFINLVSLIFLYTTNYSLYSNISYGLSIINMLIEVVIVGMILFKQDGRGLHDILAGTKVVSC